MYIKTLNRLLEKLEKINPALIREIFFNIDELYKLEIPFHLVEELIKLCAGAVTKSTEKPSQKVIFKYKNLPEYNRTLVAVSYEKQKRLMSRLIKELKEVELYFTKIEWNQRSYLLMILSKDKSVLEKDFITALKKSAKQVAK